MNLRIKNIIKVILEWLIYAAIFFVIVWGTPKALAKILHTQYPIAAITSSSMWPVLKEGDITLVKGISGKDEIEIGDIVVFSNPPGNSGQIRFTIHRVVKKGETTFTTKGDANNVDDKPTAYDKLIGKAVEIRGKPIRIPYLGKLSQIWKK